MHRGAYEDLDRTYGALGGYVAEHGIGTNDPVRELNLIGPDQAELAIGASAFIHLAVVPTVQA